MAALAQSPYRVLVAAARKEVTGARIVVRGQRQMHWGRKVKILNLWMAQKPFVANNHPQTSVHKKS
jgi:hypothetical protein